MLSAKKQDSAISPMDATLAAESDAIPLAADLASNAVASRYSILERIGSGGMGIVYLAHDSDLGRKIALKMLPGSATDRNGRTARIRLLREAQAMARIAHPNVVSVYDVGLSGEDVFIAMEYVPGTTLTKWLSTERLWRDVLDIFIATGRGLAAAHQAKLVHRDFKP